MSASPAPAAVALVALALRLAYLVDLWRTPLHQLNRGAGLDMATYLAWGEAVSRGDLSFASGGPFFQAPLYPTALGLVIAVAGPSAGAVGAVQAILGVVDCLLLFALGARLAGPAVGLVAGLLYAVYPVAWFYTGLALSENLLVTLLLVAARLLGEALEAVSLRRWALAGLACGLAALAKANALALAPVAAAAAVTLHGLRPRVLAAAGLGVGLAALVVSPPVLFIALAHGVLQPVSGQGGHLYAVGNSTTSSGLYADLCRGELLSPLTADFWLLQGRKLLLFWADADYPNNASYSIFRDHLATLGWWPFTIGPLAALGLTGLWLTLGEWRRWLGVYLVLGTYTLTIVALVIVDRWRLPAAALLCLPAAVTVVRLRSALAARPGLVALAVASTTVLLVAANASRPPDPGAFYAHLQTARLFAASRAPEAAAYELARARQVLDDLAGSAYLDCYGDLLEAELR